MTSQRDKRQLDTSSSTAASPTHRPQFDHLSRNYLPLQMADPLRCVHLQSVLEQDIFNTWTGSPEHNSSRRNHSSKVDDADKDINKQGGRSCTSTYRHLSGPSAVVLADSVFRTSCQEVAVLTTVHQGVAKTRQIHAHHVHMEGALRLLAGVC